MPSRNSNKYNAYWNKEGNKGMVGKNIRQKIGYQEKIKKTTAYTLQQELIKPLSNEPELSRCFVNKEEKYFYYQLPSQEIDDIIKETGTEGSTFVLYSQKHQDEIDKIEYPLWDEYSETDYTVKQGERTYTFIDTFNSQKEGVEAYMQKYPDAIYLGVGIFKEIRSFE